MRFNARLDKALAKVPSCLQALAGLGVSDVQKQAIDCLQRDHLANVQNGLDSLLSSEFIGCGEGPRDLASEYKQYFASDLSPR